MKSILKALPYFSLLILDLYFKHKIENSYDKVKLKFDKTGLSSKRRGIISLHRFHNEGLPFGFLKNHKNMVLALPIGISTYILYLVLSPLKNTYDIIKKVGLALILTGSASNIADRLRYSYVVDYFSIEIKRIKHIIFNLGDIYIFLGSIIYALGGFFFG